MCCFAYAVSAKSPMHQCANIRSKMRASDFGATVVLSTPNENA